MSCCTKEKTKEKTKEPIKDKTTSSCCGTTHSSHCETTSKGHEHSTDGHKGESCMSEHESETGKKSTSGCCDK